MLNTDKDGCTDCREKDEEIARLRREANVLRLCLSLMHALTGGVHEEGVEKMFEEGSGI